MSFNIENLYFSAPLPIFITGLVAWLLILLLCIASLKRSVRPGRTGLLELLRLLCATVTVFFLFNPEWRKTVEPAKQPEIIILHDESGSMSTADARLPGQADGSGEVVTRKEVSDAILATEFWKLLEKDGKHRVSVESFSKAPESEDNEASALAVTDIYSALSDRVEERPDLRAVIMIGDGDWNAREQPAPVAAAQKMRLQDIPLFSVVTGAPKRLPDLDLLAVTAPTYGIVGENVQIPFTIESSLDRDVRTIVRIRDQAGVEKTKNITIPRGSTHYDAILWRLQKEGSSTLELSIPFADGELVEKNNSRRFNIAGRPESIRALIIETLPRWEYRFIRNALSRDPGVDVDCLLLHPQLEEGDGPDYITAFPDKLEELQKDKSIVEFHKETLTEGGISEDKILAAEKILKEMFTDLDNRLAKHEWILGDKMTMADIAWIPQYALFRRNNFPFEPYPNFIAYVARWQKRPAYITAIGNHMPGSMDLPSIPSISESI